jgi:hypothetical protein
MMPQFHSAARLKITGSLILARMCQVAQNLSVFQAINMDSCEGTRAGRGETEVALTTLLVKSYVGFAGREQG